MNRKISLVLISTALICMPVVGCSNDEANKPIISLYKDYSKVVVATFTDIDTSMCHTLPTYHHKEYGDVPFVELSEFVKATKDLGNQVLSPATTVSKLANSLYVISAHNVPVFYIDPTNDVVTEKRNEYLHVESSPLNNDVGPDFTVPNDSKESCVHTSTLSRFAVEPTDIVYELKDYYIDIVEQDEKVYLPQAFISALLFKDGTSDIVYNGLDYYFNSYITGDSPLLIASKSSFNSNKMEFSFMGKVFKSYPVVGVEKYRFITQIEDKKYDIFSFKSDGTIENLIGESVTDIGVSNPLPYIFTYTVDEKTGIYMNVDLCVNETEMSLGIIKIPFEETNFNIKERSKSMCEYTYNHIRFIFDKLYGLPEELHQKYNVNNLEELIINQGIKDELLSLDSITYDKALAKLTMTYVDDCHTKYINCSSYSGYENDASSLNEEYTGTRRRGLLNLRTSLQELRTEEMVKVDPKYSDESLQQGLFFESNTAVMRFDQFSTTTALIDNTKPVDLDPSKITQLLGVSSPDGFYSAFKEIEKHSEINNVVIDLTINGGGIAATLPYLSAFFTDDPTFILKNSKSGAVAELHYNVDLNRNGVFNEPEDTYKNRYNIYLLTSGFSFSCGNALPTIARTAGVTIIGQKSGGGACAVKAYSDGCGSVFNTSNQNQIVYKDTSGNYINNDQGIPVDYELTKENWYDLAKLSAFVNSLVN